jgi:hypothetical protein
LNRKYLERKTDVSWTDHGRNKKVFKRVKEEINSLQTIKRREAY